MNDPVNDLLDMLQTEPISEPKIEPKKDTKMTPQQVVDFMSTPPPKKKPDEPTIGHADSDSSSLDKSRPTQESEDMCPIEDLPVPEGVSEKVVEAVKSDKVDDKLYYYHDLAEEVSKIADDKFVPSFITRVDELIDGGFRGGELMILSGPTKSGKTTLAQTISYAQAQNGFSTVWFTLEMSWQELTRKFMEMDDRMKREGKPTEVPLLYPIDNTNLSLEWLEAQIIKAQKENDANMVFIDHLHFLVPLNKSDNASLLIGGIVREVKKMSVKLNIPIVLIAHTKKLKPDERPTIESVRDSSFIGQESDYLFMIWRERIAESKTSAAAKSVGESDSQSAWAKQKGLEGKVQAHSLPDDEEEYELYTDRTFLSLETNRRNGKTKRFSIFFHDGKFHEREEYEKLLNPVPSLVPETPPEPEKEVVVPEEPKKVQLPMEM